MSKNDNSSASFARSRAADTIDREAAFLTVLPVPLHSVGDERAHEPTNHPTYPLFLRLRGKRVVVVGAGPVATSKLGALLEAGADVVVVAPDATARIRELARNKQITLHERSVYEYDIADAWLVMAAAPPAINRLVHAWGERRHTFVLAVDDMESTDAFCPAVFSRGDVRVAMSSEGRAPALVGLLREALEQTLPDEDRLAEWMKIAVDSRAEWKRDGLPHAERRAQLLAKLVKNA